MLAPAAEQACFLPARRLRRHRPSDQLNRSPAVRSEASPARPQNQSSASLPVN